MLCLLKTIYITLSFLISKICRNSYFLCQHLRCFCLSAVDNGYHETFSFSTLWNEANLTIIQIMQLKRIYFRRLKLKLIFTRTILLRDMLVIHFGLLSKPIDPIFSKNKIDLQIYKNLQIDNLDYF